MIVRQFCPPAESVTAVLIDKLPTGEIGTVVMVGFYKDTPDEVWVETENGERFNLQASSVNEFVRELRRARDRATRETAS